MVVTFKKALLFQLYYIWLNGAVHKKLRQKRISRHKMHTEQLVHNFEGPQNDNPTNSLLPGLYKFKNSFSYCIKVTSMQSVIETNVLLIYSTAILCNMVGSSTSAANLYVIA